ncbi:metal ABC transporter solute-binding protein, Zn/Mn family [Propionicimonas sp.]|uniref:metal ABC transporter solute-binding protein, Zn/Mn family n=1 Tax=Propionicimonas sp. TaxID=1955623 RepID=UPI0039E57326
METRRRSLAALAALAVTALAGCAGTTPAATPATSAAGSASAAAATINVVASTNVWGDIAGQIGGSQVAVTSIIDNPDADPHEYQASSRNQLALSQAQVVIENGGGYDDFVDTMLQASGNTSATVLNAVDISGHKAAAGEELNEHVWYDYATVAKVAGELKDAFSAASPSEASTFEANTSTFLSGLDALNGTVADLKKKDAGKGAAITEPMPVYLLEAMGLVNKTPDEFSEAIENDTDVPAKVLAETLALFSDHDVAVLAYNSQTTGPQTEKVLAAAKAANVPVVPVQETLPAGTSYLEWQGGIVDALGQALAQ